MSLVNKSIYALSLCLFVMVACESKNTVITESYGDKKGNNHVRWIPTDGLPNNKLQTNYYGLLQNNLLGHDLVLPDDKKPWSSSFFPAFYGGVAGKRNQGFFKRLYHNMFGDDVPERLSTILLAHQAATGSKRAEKKLMSKLSATEKYDVAVAEYRFLSSRHESRERGYNKSGLPSVWTGYCNGVSAAAIAHLAEPYRVVDVINRDGYTVRFHPSDTKGLLALAYFHIAAREYHRIGSRCKNSGGRDHLGRVRNEACRDVNPAAFAIAIANRIGIAESSFVVDKYQFHKVSNHPIGEAKIDTLKAPYAYAELSAKEKRRYPYAAEGTTHLVDVAFRLVVGSTTLSYGAGNHRAPELGHGFYEKVGFVANKLTYYATLELDAAGEIIGGEWTKNKRKAPDFAWFGSKPYVVDASRVIDVAKLKGSARTAARKANAKLRCQAGDNCEVLRVNPYMRWDVIEKIYTASVADATLSASVDLRQLPKIVAKKIMDVPLTYAHAQGTIASKLHFSYRRSTRKDFLWLGTLSVAEYSGADKAQVIAHSPRGDKVVVNRKLKLNVYRNGDDGPGFFSLRAKKLGKRATAVTVRFLSKNEIIAEYTEKI